MNIFFNYIFKKENLHNVISFPFSLHLIKKDNLEILTCKKRNLKYYFQIWNLKNFSGYLPEFKEIETTDFSDYLFNNIDKNKLININNITYNRTNFANNAILTDEVFNHFYKNIIINNIENLQEYKRGQLFEYLFKKHNYIIKYNCVYAPSKVLNKLELKKWKVCENFLLKDMFPAELIFNN